MNLDDDPWASSNEAVVRSLLAKHGRRELGKRMGLTSEGMRMTIRRPPARRVAVLIAFVAGVSIDEVVSGAWPSVCPTCGCGE